MAERPNAVALRATVLSGLMGSNPIPTVFLRFWRSRVDLVDSRIALTSVELIEGIKSMPRWSKANQSYLEILSDRITEDEKAEQRRSYLNTI